MKTRENELHEPKISHSRIVHFSDGIHRKEFCIDVFCTSCDKYLCGLSKGDTSEKDYAFEERVLKKIPNYCPNCGARLKELEK